VIPNELIALHAANLAHMTRMRLGDPAGRLLIWCHDTDTGAVACHSYAPALPLALAISDLKIVWDEHLRAKVRRERERHLPNETGGVLLGYFDLVAGTVTIVDALSAPADSREEQTGFVRGADGLEEAVGEVGRRTANIVRYVGEWHSHPRNHSARASRDDVLLLAHLAAALGSEGLPALMLIIGATEERWFIGKAS
jgi:integrative and conjugative element protein (TIGR02256 family)